MIDTHAHLNNEKLIEDAKLYVENAKQVGVEKIFNVGWDMDSSRLAVELADKYSECYAIVGVHPESHKTWDENTLNNLQKLADSKKVVAIGEIGLEYHYDPNKEAQKEIFEKQINLALKLNLPFVVHSRDAMGDTLEILEKYKDKIAGRFCFHCYSGSEESLDRIIKMGGMISLGGAITFKNARRLVDIVEVCPLDKLMLETDCPYMAPEPYRGKLNQPKYVLQVAKEIAYIKDLPLKEVQQQTTKNALKFFGLK